MMLKSLIVLLLAAVPASGGTAGTTADAKFLHEGLYRVAQRFHGERGI